MAVDKRTTKDMEQDYQQLSTMDNIRLIAGFVLMLTGAFLFSSIVSYLFYWAEDMSAIAEIGVPMANPEFSNICGQWGAQVAHRLVGEGFGLFAIVISFIFLIQGWRLFRYKPLKLYRFLLIFSLVLVLGSLTMGYIFGTAWNLFGSGLGGEYGIALSIWLKGMMGGVGTLLLILLGWIMTGLLINRNFLHVVDSAGEQVAGGITSVTKKAFSRLGRHKDDKQREENVELEEENEEPVIYNEHEQEPLPATEPAPEDIFIVEPLTEEQQREDDAYSPIGDVVSPVDVDDILGLPEEQTEEKENSGDDALVITVKEYKPKDAEEQPMEVELYDPMLDLAHYEPPTAQLLVDHKSVSSIDEDEIFRNKERIRETLLHFHIPIISMTATVGPTVTLYEIVQEPGVKISRIQGLEDDLAQNLKAQSVRIIAPMPGKGTVGIEVPNHTKQTVSMRSSICSEEFQNSKAELPVVIGRTIQNENYTFDLAKLPHLLVAGATGQGKSVGLNAIITSLLYKKHPAELKLVLIDPKMVEFSLYNKLEKHFLAKMESENESIVTDPKKAVYTLNALCTEMANRLELCKKANAKNIVEYNDKFRRRQLNPENGHRFLPYIVVVIDEFADLIMTAKEVEAPVMRLAQKARAVGKGYYRWYQGQFPCAYRFPCYADDRLANNYRPAGS